MSLPIYPDNKAIASGLKPEKGPLQFYNWQEYINPKVVKLVREEVRRRRSRSRRSRRSTRRSPRSQSGAVQYDVFVPETPDLEQLVVGKLLAPLNLDYIPNLEANVWPALVNPWYDYGSQYTVPYTVYTTGIGWRTDKLPNFNPENYANPWSSMWIEGPKISGLVGMLDDQHDGLALGLLHNGVTDVNTENAEPDLNAAQKSISASSSRTPT